MILAVSLIIIVIGVIVLSYPKRIKQSLPFGDTFDLSGLPIITFQCNDQKLSLMIDSGSNVNYIKASAAKRIKANIMHDDSCTVGCSGSLNQTDKCTVSFSDGMLVYEDEFFVSDFEGLQKIYEYTGCHVDGMIGNTFLTKYKCILDFNQYKLITNGNIH